jgi:hypothetical protein
MRNVIVCVITCLFNLPALAIDYNDFPPNLQKNLDERIAELDPNEGICIAGRVTMDDEAHIGSGKDVKVNLEYGISTSLWVYDDGWFVMSRTAKNSPHSGPAKLILRAFGYDPINASIAVSQGQMTYVEYVMHKTPVEKLSSVAGIIVNDQNEPVEGTMVNISFPLPYSPANEQPSMSIQTEPNGYYLFEGLSATEYNLWVRAISGYAGISFNVKPVAGKTAISNQKLYQNRSIVIDYVYQADGNRSFAEGNIKKGTVEWVHGPDGMDFSEGKVKEYDYKLPRDIEMGQDKDTLRFQIFYSNGKGNGFYDAGEVDFESVTEAAESDYTIMPKPCIIGHVYVVRTYENNYAKFIVRSISENK